VSTTLSLYGICPDALRSLRRFPKIRHGSFEPFATLCNANQVFFFNLTFTPEGNPTSTASTEKDEVILCHAPAFLVVKLISLSL
jgi:hypothetical protein